MRQGTTLAEVAVVLALIGLCTGISIPRFRQLRDEVDARAAASAAVALLATARHAAIRRGRITAVVFDTASASIVVESGPDTLSVRPLGVLHGVRLAVTRDSIAYAPNGMGYGAANTSIVMSRGVAAETVTVSRLGRVRR